MGDNVVCSVLSLLQKGEMVIRSERDAKDAIQFTDAFLGTGCSAPLLPRYR